MESTPARWCLLLELCALEAKFKPGHTTEATRDKKESRKVSLYKQKLNVIRCLQLLTPHQSSCHRDKALVTLVVTMAREVEVGAGRPPKPFPNCPAKEQERVLVPLLAGRVVGLDGNV